MVNAFINNACLSGIFVAVLFILMFIIKIYSELKILNFNLSLYHNIRNVNFQQKED